MRVNHLPSLSLRRHRKSNPQGESPRAGVRVCYVAKLFENDGSPFAMINKGLRRAMAAEYSRELSGKTSAGQRHLVSLGFRRGAQPGYGLRLQLLNARGELRTVMP